MDLTTEEKEWLERRMLEHKLLYFSPYEKQQEFFAAGRTVRERLLMAGNQLGKSEAGAFETACHLTGEYPEWWIGRRWERPVRGWAVGETSLVTRDVSQKKLCGSPGVIADHGTGYIPKDRFVDKPSLSRGVTDAYDTIQVRHKSGGTSVLVFKSYEQGRQKMQGDSIDFGWCDEEPDEDVYSEIRTRTNATGGMVYTTFTPLKGMSAVVMRFLNEPSPDRHVVTMIIDDAKHISPEKRQQIIDSYAPHEREARTKGIPMLGSGRIFPYTEESVSCPTFQLDQIPPHWFKLWAIDFGIGHKFGAVLGLIDNDADCIYVHHAFKIADQLPIMHAKQIMFVAGAVPVAWPHDGNTREKSTGDNLAKVYKNEGLLMLPTHATWKEGGISTEKGILEMQQRFATGRLKISAHLLQMWEEYRLYHRKDGEIVKLHDDLMSALRILVMAKRFAKQVALGPITPGKSKPRNNGVADGMDFDIFQS